MEADFWGDSILRNRPPHYSRDYRRRRCIADPDYLKAHNERTRKWAAEKIKRCPEYAELIRVNNRLNKLRQIIADHQHTLAKRERELIATAKRYTILRERCKGK